MRRKIGEEEIRGGQVLPRCPEPLGMKLQMQALLVVNPEEEGDREKAINAMRHTLDDIEKYGLSIPVSLEKEK